MNGKQEFLTYLIEGKSTRFVIPVYQRSYDWKQEQCKRLFDDLVDVAKSDSREHFFGSIVSKTPRGQRVVIDGQQRITTVFLLLAAMRKQLKEGVVSSENDKLAAMIDDQYLVDKYHEGEEKLRLKLVKSDSAAFVAVLADEGGHGGISADGNDLLMDSNVTQNYLYFCKRIAHMEISVDDLLDAVKSLSVIDINP